MNLHYRTRWYLNAIRCLSHDPVINRKKGDKLSGKVSSCIYVEYMTLVGKNCASYLSASSAFFLSPLSFFMDSTRRSSRFFLNILVLRPGNTITHLITKQTSLSITNWYISSVGVAGASPIFDLRRSFSFSLSAYIPAN